MKPLEQTGTLTVVLKQAARALSTLEEEAAM